jgi:hypothetical protein
MAIARPENQDRRLRLDLRDAHGGYSQDLQRSTGARATRHTRQPRALALTACIFADPWAAGVTSLDAGSVAVGFRGGVVMYRGGAAVAATAHEGNDDEPFLGRLPS